LMWCNVSLASEFCDGFKKGLCKVLCAWVFISKQVKRLVL